MTTAIAWPVPSLENPIDVEIVSGKQVITLDPAKDYRLHVTAPLTGVGGLVILGGRNVVMVGGETQVPDTDDPDGLKRRGLYLKGQTGVIHIEGFHVGGVRLSDGIQLDQRLGATVQLQNVLVDTVHGSRNGWHADILQTWAGPKTLRINRLVGSSEYQGLFLLPRQYFPAAVTKHWDFRNIDITGKAGSAFLLWKELELSIACSNVHVRREGTKSTYGLLWPSTSEWPGAGYSSVVNKTLIGKPGMDYVSPA
jgi:hypothetical protein